MYIYVCILIAERNPESSKKTPALFDLSVAPCIIQAHPKGPEAP